MIRCLEISAEKIGRIEIGTQRMSAMIISSSVICAVSDRDLIFEAADGMFTTAIGETIVLKGI